MWPKVSTAFFVIHGNGPHKPYETLDLFVRGFHKVLATEHPELEMEHKLKRHDQWTQSYISFSLPSQDATIDFYEYYWDCYMIRDLTLGELLSWLECVDKGIKACKKEFNGKVSYNAFLFRFLTGWFSWARSGIRLVNYLPSSALKDFVTRKLSENLMDTVIYTLSDQRSSYYDMRRKMLSGAVEELSEIVNDEYYKQIIVAGHSMGSVIGYDALTRIAVDISAPGGISRFGVSSASATKIKGLVTFGSFLDLVALLFRERIPDCNSVQRQILAHRLGFRSKHAEGKQIAENGGLEIRSHVHYDWLNKVEWLNFYHPKDYVVNQGLQAYKLEQENQYKCTNEAESRFKAHNSYWSYDQMYVQIAERFFK